MAPLADHLLGYIDFPTGRPTSFTDAYGEFREQSGVLPTVRDNFPPGFRPSPNLRVGEMGVNREIGMNQAMFGNQIMQRVEPPEDIDSLKELHGPLTPEQIRGYDRRTINDLLVKIVQKKISVSATPPKGLSIDEALQDSGRIGKAFQQLNDYATNQEKITDSVDKGRILMLKQAFETATDKNLDEWMKEFNAIKKFLDEAKGADERVDRQMEVDQAFGLVKSEESGPTNAISNPISNPLRPTSPDTIENFIPQITKPSDAIETVIPQNVKTGATSRVEAIEPVTGRNEAIPLEAGKNLEKLQQAVRKVMAEMDRSTQSLTNFVANLPKNPNVSAEVPAEEDMTPKVPAAAAVPEVENAQPLVPEVATSFEDTHAHTATPETGSTTADEQIPSDIPDALKEVYAKWVKQGPVAGESTEDKIQRLFDAKKEAMLKLGVGHKWDDVPPVHDMYTEKLRRTGIIVDDSQVEESDVADPTAGDSNTESNMDAHVENVKKNTHVQPEEPVPASVVPASAPPTASANDGSLDLEALMKPYRDVMEKADAKVIEQLKKYEPSYHEMQRIMHGVQKAGKASTIGELAAKLPDVSQMNEDFERDLQALPLEGVEILPDHTKMTRPSMASYDQVRRMLEGSDVDFGAMNSGYYADRGNAYANVPMAKPFGSTDSSIRGEPSPFDLMKIPEFNNAMQVKKEDLFQNDVNKFAFPHEDEDLQIDLKNPDLTKNPDARPKDFATLFREMNDTGFDKSGKFDVNRYFSSIDDMGMMNAGNSETIRLAREDLMAQDQDLSTLKGMDQKQLMEYMQNMFLKRGMKFGMDEKGNVTGEKTESALRNGADNAMPVEEKNLQNNAILKVGDPNTIDAESIAKRLAAGDPSIRELQPGEEPSPNATVVSSCDGGAEDAEKGPDALAPADATRVSDAEVQPVSDSAEVYNAGKAIRSKAIPDSNRDNIDDALSKAFDVESFDNLAKQRDYSMYPGVQRVDHENFRQQLEKMDQLEKSMQANVGLQGDDEQKYASLWDDLTKDMDATGDVVSTTTGIKPTAVAAGAVGPAQPTPPAELSPDMLKGLRDQLMDLKGSISAMQGGKYQTLDVAPTVTPEVSDVQKLDVTQSVSNTLGLPKHVTQFYDKFPPMFNEERDLLDPTNLKIDDETIEEGKDLVDFVRNSDKIRGWVDPETKKQLELMKGLTAEYDSLAKKMQAHDAKEHFDEAMDNAVVPVAQPKPPVERTATKTIIPKASFANSSSFLATESPKAFTHIENDIVPKNSNQNLSRKLHTAFLDIGSTIPPTTLGKIPTRSSIPHKAFSSFVVTHKDVQQGPGVGLKLCCAKKLGRCLNDSRCPKGFFKCPNGCMNMKKIVLRGKNSLKDQKIRFDDQFHVLTVKGNTKPKLKHKNEDCWRGCHERKGWCSWCGTGMCCRQDDPGNGCDGDNGPKNNHACVNPPVKRAPDHIYNQNMGRPCFEACKDKQGVFQRGPCLYCGRGMCCAKGMPGGGCDGDAGGDATGPMKKETDIFQCVPGPPAIVGSGGSNAWHDGLRAGAEILVVNGDSKNFRKRTARVIEDIINGRDYNELYVMGPPSKKKECSDPAHACNTQAERYGKPQPEGCKDQVGCDSDQICCCAMKMRDLPCHEDEYKAPSSPYGKSVCSEDPNTVRSSNVLGDQSSAGWSDMNIQYG